MIERDRGGSVFLALVAALAIAAPVLNQVVPASSPFHLSTYSLTLVGKYMCYAMLALAVDLIWGYAGILSLGHAASSRWAATPWACISCARSVARRVRRSDPSRFHGLPQLAEAAVVLGRVDHFWFALIVIAAVPAALALVFGWFAFRSRVTGVYFSIMTQALSYALMLAFFRNDMASAATTASQTSRTSWAFDLHADRTRVGARRGHRGGADSELSRLPRDRRVARRALVSARSATPKAARGFSGTASSRTSSGSSCSRPSLAGIAGALYVPQVASSIRASSRPSTRLRRHLVAVGGRGTLFGAAMGAVLVNYAKTYFTGALPELWLYALGALFVLVTLFLPRGLVGLGARRRRVVQAGVAAPVIWALGSSVGVSLGSKLK